MAPHCSGCGLEVLGGIAGCQALFDELITRDFSDYRYARFHRLAVDAYSLQHPDRYCMSPKSLMAHLGGLCCAFEHEADPSVYRALQRSLNGISDLEKPLLPSFRGPLTIADVLRASDPESYAREVERWARSVWEAHANLHAFASAWLQRALAARQAPGKAGDSKP